jgi:hypothetical protein
MDKNKFIKWLLIIGGVVEIILGPLIIAVPYALELIGFTTIPIFTQMAGAFIFGFGILLIITSKDIGKYLVIPLVNILLRGIVIFFSFFTLATYPEFIGIFIFASIYDTLWSISLLTLLIKSNYIRKKSKD